jgi:outer membrane lipoprotein-sorting protein
MTFERWRLRSAVIFLGMALLSFLQVAHASEPQPVRMTVERVAHLFSSKSSIATIKMQIVNEDGQHEIVMKLWSLGDKVMVRILGPQNEAGIAILKEGNDIQYYLPKSNRTVKVPPSTAMTSWMGSDFTIDDLVKETFLARDYSISTSFEGQRGGIAVYEYTLTPKPGAAVVWGKIVLQIRQADSVPTWQGFYDEDGKLVRELTFSQYKTMGGRLIPTRLVMQPADKAGARTTIEYEGIAFDVPIGAEAFILPDHK